MTELSLENVREHAREFEEEHHEPIRKIIAVLIMSISVLVAGAAYFETRAGNREALAERVQQQAMIVSIAASAASSRNESEEFTTNEMYEELASLSNDALGLTSVYARELEKAYGAAAAKVGCSYTHLFGSQYQQPHCGFNYWRFFEDQQRLPALASANATAAAQADRGWAGERGRLVTVITIFAVSLFLVGLTLTVPPSARMPFLFLGSFAAVLALLWGIVIIASSVKSPSERAILAFANGSAALTTAESETSQRVPEAQIIAKYQNVVALSDTAIAAGENGANAYIDRGDAYLELDLSRPQGPRGSVVARADFSRAAAIDPENYIAWGDLGAADFWLGDYRGSLAATERALSLPDPDPTFDANEALDDAVLGQTIAYHRSLARLRARFEHVPSTLRDFVVALYRTAVVDAEAFRPAIATRVEAFDQDLHSIADSVTVAEKDDGAPTAPPSPASVTYLGYSASGDHLTINFRVSGMKPAMSYLDYVYVNNSAWAPFGPEPWSKAAGQLTRGVFSWTLTSPTDTRWARGTHVLMEIFVDGSLRAAKEFVVA